MSPKDLGYVGEDSKRYSDAVESVRASKDPMTDKNIRAAFDELPVSEGIKNGKMVARKKSSPKTEGGSETTTGDENNTPKSEAPNATKTAIKLAKEHKIDLSTVNGSGKKGRIGVDDVKKVLTPA